MSTLTIKEIHEYPLKISFDNEIMKGFIIGYAKILSKSEIKELMEEVESGSLQEDESLMRRLYSRFTGLPDCEGEAAFEFITNGKYSNYLIPPIIRRYFEHYGEAKSGNSSRRR